MVRVRLDTTKRPRRSPRASGGGPRATSCRSSRRPFSPRERGWSARARPRWCHHGVLPARAGVVRSRRATRSRAPSSPRASGGGPAPTLVAAGVDPFSPRERGWSDGADARRAGASVLPARAGVVRSDRRPSACGPRSPRASGGGPHYAHLRPDRAAFSPRERGWSGHQVAVEVVDGVLPARAGVVRITRPRCRWWVGSPRASGGGPDHASTLQMVGGFSPRERGWSGTTRRCPRQQPVLPARAGVVRDWLRAHAGRSGSPRASGGGPAGRIVSPERGRFFPRERGWSLMVPCPRPPWEAATGTG